MAKKKAPVSARSVNSLLEEDEAVTKVSPGGDDDDGDLFADVLSVDDVTPEPKKAKSKPGAATDKKPKKTQVMVDLEAKSGRQLTKKDQLRLAEWGTSRRGKLLDGFFARQADEARKKFGHKSVFLGSEAETLVIGIPCPALSFEFVIGQDCFPLGLVVQIVAKHGIGKSGLLAEFGRWFDMAGGGMVLCENETKFNPHWYTSIMGEEVYQRMQLHRCTSVEDWQEHLTWATKKMRDDMTGTKEAPGPGKKFPVLFGVDSIMGKMSRENQEKILGKQGKKGKLGTTGEGFAQARSFPIEAGSITKYMRTYPQLIDDWPFSLVLINHLRMKVDDAGNPERNKTGGEQVNFQESFELELKKYGGHANKIQSADFEGIPLTLSCEKNSFGPTGRKVHTRILWRHEEDEQTGETVQKSIWDWDWSTVHMLNNLLRGEKASTYLRARLKKMDFHLECPTSGDIDNSAWSATLGMKAKDAVPWNEMGALIRENAEVTAGIRKALGIVNRPLLKGDYFKQKAKLAEEMP